MYPLDMYPDGCFDDFLEPYIRIRDKIARYIMTTNHKDIGTLYLCSGFISGLIGTYFSILIRLQLAAPHNDFLAGIINIIMLLLQHMLLSWFFSWLCLL